MDYNKNFIDLVSELCSFQSELNFIKQNNQVVLRAKEENTKIAYTLYAPENYFDFPGDYLGFYDFTEFRKYFKIYDNPNKDTELADAPVLDVNFTESGNIYQVLIKSSKSNQQLKCTTAPRGILEDPNFNGVKLPSVDATLNMSVAQIDNLKKMISIIKPASVKMTFKNDVCEISFENIVNHNEFTCVYNLTKPIDDTFVVETDIIGINGLPSGDYEVNVCNRGYLHYHQVRADDIDLNLYVSKIKKR